MRETRRVRVSKRYTERLIEKQRRRERENGDDAWETRKTYRQKRERGGEIKKDRKERH